MPDLLRRRLAVLGGTTDAGDFAVALRQLAAPGRLVDGPALAEYERAFARTVGVRHAVSFASGRVGLYGILAALGIGAGDEVLLQVPTHVVVPNAVRYLGATPVFVDCRLDTYNMDLADAERKVTPRTKALLLQHTFGYPADIDAAAALAARHGLHLVEDCVHALGARYRQRPVGSLGTAAFFSTEETKTISTVMGGVAVTDDERLAGQLSEFRSRCEPPPAAIVARYLVKFVLYHVLTEPHVHPIARAVYERSGRYQPAPAATSAEEERGERPPGYQRRLSNAQAALGLRQLARLNRNVAHRTAIAAAYAERLGPLGFAPPAVLPAAEPAVLRYPVWVRDRAAAQQAAGPHAVLGTWFTSVLEEARSPADVGYVNGSCPRAEEAARHLVNLPTHQRVTLADVQQLTTALARLAAVPA